MKSKLIVLSLVVALLTSVAAPSFAGRAQAAAPVAAVHVASAVHTHPAFLDKTRFLLHVGLGFGAFHRYVYARYRNGSFAAGAPKRTSNLIKAAIALVFTIHEFKVAYGIAENSNSQTLQAIVRPLNNLAGQAGYLTTKFKRGQYNPSDVQALNNNANQFQSFAANQGYKISDRTVTVPGAA